MYLQTSTHKQDATQGQVLSGVFTSFNSVFHFKTAQLCTRKNSWIHTFPLRILALCEMQAVLSKISTWVAVSISYDGNH